MPAQPPPTAYKPGTVLTVGTHEVQIEKYISEGGFAHVYTCRTHPPLPHNALACLKRVAVPDKAYLNLLRAEVDAMQRLAGHSNVVQYIDSHAERMKSGVGYEVFLLMEYCAGGGLIDFMNTRLRDQLKEHEVLKIMSDVTVGLAHMHTLNPPLIHRDLKIENVLLTGDGTYKLCDFGSVSPVLRPPKNAAEFRILEDDIQHHTTMQYRSPEMLDLYRGFPIDQKADIWALGVFLYKLCYYTTPFETGGNAAILNSSYVIPQKPHYSDRLKNMIRVLLQPNPTQRPNVYQVLEEISAMRGVETPLVEPPPQQAQPVSKAATPEVLEITGSTPAPTCPTTPALKAQKSHSSLRGFNYEDNSELLRRNSQQAQPVQSRNLQISSGSAPEPDHGQSWPRLAPKPKIYQSSAPAATPAQQPAPAPAPAPAQPAPAPASEPPVPTPAPASAPASVPAPVSASGRPLPPPPATKPALQLSPSVSPNAVFSPKSQPLHQADFQLAAKHEDQQPENPPAHSLQNAYNSHFSLLDVDSDLYQEPTSPARSHSGSAFDFTEAEISDRYPPVAELSNDSSHHRVNDSSIRENSFAARDPSPHPPLPGRHEHGSSSYPRRPSEPGDAIDRAKALRARAQAQIEAAKAARKVPPGRPVQSKPRPRSTHEKSLIDLSSHVGHAQDDPRAYASKLKRILTGLSERSSTVVLENEGAHIDSNMDFLRSLDHESAQARPGSSISRTEKLRGAGHSRKQSFTSGWFGRSASSGSGRGGDHDTMHDSEDSDPVIVQRRKSASQAGPALVHSHGFGGDNSPWSPSATSLSSSPSNDSFRPSNSIQQRVHAFLSKDERAQRAKSEKDRDSDGSSGPTDDDGSDIVSSRSVPSLSQYFITKTGSKDHDRAAGRRSLGRPSIPSRLSKPTLFQRDQIEGLATGPSGASRQLPPKPSQLPSQTKIRQHAN